MDTDKNMVCIQDELNQMGLGQTDLPFPNSDHHHHHQITDSSTENTCQNGWPPNPGNFVHPDKPIGWMHGLLGCMKPVLSFIGKAGVIDIKHKQTEDWEIPYESITKMEYIGSGAQGTVFSGELNNEIVAVKKVRDFKDTDIKHLRKLDHENIIKFKGVCTQAPVFCIIMEFCPYGPLQNILKEEEVVLPSRLVSWAKQIALGMQYLHSHKIIHRDLKSPNILIGAHEVVKISDFGTSREWNEISTKMSFAGTVSWMAPEVIRHEPCSEKVDIWSYGVVLWEMLTCEIPYKDVQSSAVIWGVGNNSLQLPIPSTCPAGFKLLVQLCWSIKPRNRPSFSIILNHLEIAGPELLKQSEKEFFETQRSWKQEIRSHMKQITQNGTSIHKYEQDLIKRRQAEWQHAQDIRIVYEQKLDKTNKLYRELTECKAQLEEKEKEIAEREKKLPGYKPNRRFGTTLKNIKYYRRRLNNSSTIVLPDYQSSTPSPESTPESPVKATLYAQLDGSSQPKSVVVVPQKPKKHRHRRVGSGSFASPKSSPNRERRYQSEPENRKVKLVDNETQTDAMDISETDASPSPFCASRELSFSLKAAAAAVAATTTAPTESRVPNYGETVKQIAEPQRPSDLNVRQQSPSSPNGNSNEMSTSDITYQDACSSSPDQFLDDAMNSNERLDFRDCSDDDNLERLGRKVSELITKQSTTLVGENGNDTEVVVSDVIFSPSGKRRVGANENIIVRHAVIRTSGGHAKGRRADLGGDISNESQEDRCDDSWSDEEGEDTDYNYSLRRKSIGRLPIGRGMRSRRLYKGPVSSPIANNPRRSVIISDEENTSECSHSPSSQHSTLESNPDMQKVLKKMKKMTDSDEQEEVSESESDDPSQSTIATQMQCQNNEILVTAGNRV